MGDSSQQRSEVREVGVNMNGVEVPRNLRVWLICQRRIERS